LSAPRISRRPRAASRFNRLGVLDLLEAARGVGSEAHRIKRRLHDIDGGAQVNPVLLRVSKKVTRRSRSRVSVAQAFGSVFFEAQNKLVAFAPVTPRARTLCSRAHWLRTRQHLLLASGCPDINSSAAFSFTHVLIVPRVWSSYESVCYGVIIPNLGRPQGPRLFEPNE